MTEKMLLNFEFALHVLQALEKVVFDLNDKKAYRYLIFTNPPYYHTM